MRPLLLLSLVALLAGCASEPAGGEPPAEPSPEPPAPVEPLTWSQTLSPHRGLEANFVIPAGGTIHYWMNASVAASWDVHSHDGREVVTWEKGESKTAEGTFTAPSDNTYSIYVVAGDSTTTVLITVIGDATLLPPR